MTAVNSFRDENLNFFYTIKLISVDNPSEGIRFLTNIRDGDSLWDDYAFHLYEDKDNKLITNITIGKFTDLESANKIVTKLKDKGLSLAKVIKKENDFSE